jgi:hypothetical protein
MFADGVPAWYWRHPSVSCPPVSVIEPGGKLEQTAKQVAVPPASAAAY